MVASIQPPHAAQSPLRLNTSVRLTCRSGFSPADGMIEAGEATPTTQNHTTINREAGGGIGGSITVKKIQQSAVIEVENWVKIQQLLDIIAAAADAIQTQQPTGLTD